MTPSRDWQEAWTTSPTPKPASVPPREPRFDVQELWPEANSKGDPYAAPCDSTFNRFTPAGSRPHAVLSCVSGRLPPARRPGCDRLSARADLRLDGCCYFWGGR